MEAITMNVYLIERIEDELEDAEEYMWKALDHKHSAPALADTLYKIADAEMQHAQMLKAQLSGEIEHHMREWLEHKWTDEMLKVKRMQDMFPKK